MYYLQTIHRVLSGALLMKLPLFLHQVCLEQIPVNWLHPRVQGKQGIVLMRSSWHVCDVNIEDKTEREENKRGIKIQRKKISKENKRKFEILFINQWRMQDFPQPQRC